MARTFDGTFTSPVANGPKVFSLPFFNEGDRETRVFRQNYIVRIDSYTPPDFMDTDFVDGNVFYLVEETPMAHLGGGMGSFDRIYAMIPVSRVTPRQMSYTFPGLSSNQVYTQVNISSSSTSSGQTTFTCASSPSISAGDRLVIFATETQNPAGVQVAFTTRRTALAGTSGTTIITDAVVASQGLNTLTFQSLVKVDDGRDPRTNAVTAFVFYDYFVPGLSANVDTVEDIPVYQPEIIIDANGKETDTYSGTTVPTRTSYETKVAAGSLVVAEHSKIIRWRGDIYERSTPYVKAE